MLSICITVKNRSLVRVDGHELHLFPNCVESIVRSVAADSDVELVVADWASDDRPLEEWLDETVAPIRHRVITLQGDFNRGRGRNRAAKAARGEAMFFLDADCTIDASVLAAGIRAVERGMACFPVVYSFDSPSHTTGWWRDSGYGNCFVARDVFQRAGGWPEYDGWGKEDDDFFRRVSSLLTVVRKEAPGFYHQWHPEDIVWKDRYTAHLPWLVDELRRRDAAVSQLQRVCEAADTLILVDEARFGDDVLPGRRTLPFIENQGEYWGPPPDDTTAIRELERMRQQGAQLIVFAWMSFWWLEFYAEFARHLETNYRRELTTPEVVVFDLGERIPQLQ